MGLFQREKKCYDGYLVKKLDPIVFMMPYIMPRKADSEVKVELRIDLEKVEQFIREQKKENIKELTLFHIVFASIVRAATITPEINRFIAGNRIYQRKHVRISMVVKKELAITGKESTIFPTFQTTDTLKDIVTKIKHETDAALLDKKADSNDFDKLTRILYLTPPFLLRTIVGFIMFLDRHGRLPKFLVDLQPFHSGFFISNVGSIGLPVVYHHLYEFGTTTCFATIGKKEMVHVVNASGEVVRKRYLPLKFVLDERICDGFTYSCAFRTIKKCFDNPEWLLESYNGNTI
jgi:hypothetical protein